MLVQFLCVNSTGMVTECCLTTHITDLHMHTCVCVHTIRFFLYGIIRAHLVIVCCCSTQRHNTYVDQLEQENREEKNTLHQLREKNADLASRLVNAKSACKCSLCVQLFCYIISLCVQQRSYKLRMMKLKQSTKMNRENCTMYVVNQEVFVCIVYV